MLIYHPAYDAYHCAFRFLLFTETLKVVEIDKLRILDFYFVFPAELKNVRLPKGHSDEKKRAENFLNIYHGPVNSTQTFRDMEPIQMAAIRALAASKLIDEKQFELGIAARTETDIPLKLQESLNIALQRNDTMLPYLISKFAAISLLGAEGLKERTKLMEYRYDVA